MQGPDHPDTITACGSLASAYHSARKLTMALPLYERTLADCERVHGADHPDTLASLGNLAHAYHTAGRLTEALAVFERTLAECERVLGPGHPLTETARENYRPPRRPDPPRPPRAILGRPGRRADSVWDHPAGEVGAGEQNSLMGGES